MCCSGYEFRRLACIPYRFAPPSLGDCQHRLWISRHLVQEGPRMHLLRRVVDLRMLPGVPLGCSDGCTVVQRLVSLIA